MMAFNFKLPCAVTCSIISFRGVRQVKNNNNERRNYPKGQINNFVVSPLLLVGTPTCQSSSLLIGLLELRHTRVFCWRPGETPHTHYLTSFRATRNLLFNKAVLRATVETYMIGQCLYNVTTSKLIFFMMLLHKQYNRIVL